MNALAHLLTQKKSLLMPVAHDAIVARLIQHIGFDTYAIGGFGVAASRFGYPDFGIVSYREMRDATIEITRSVSLPVLVDADGGYGDFLNIERLVQDYSREPNIHCIFLEDQVHPKRCGHLRGKHLISTEDMTKKLRIATQTRSSKDLWIMARTDARSVDGIDEALRRSEAYLQAGADALFIESPESEDELARIALHFKGIPLMANMLNGGKTPIVSQTTLEQMGYQLIGYPVVTLLLMTHAVKQGLEILKTTGSSLTLDPILTPMKEFHELIGVTTALAKEEQYGSIATRA